jgi:predicted nucleic-acid-binding protein
MIETVKARRNDSTEQIDILLHKGTNNKKQQLAQAVDPAFKDDKLHIKNNTFIVEAVEEFWDTEAGFVRRDLLIRQI